MKSKKQFKTAVLLGFALFLLFGGLTPTQVLAKAKPSEINPDAFVYILNVGIEGNTLKYNGLRNGFVVANGDYVLTAAHCVNDFQSSNDTLRQPMIISPYYGDIFEADIIAVDDANDIAILKPAWHGHPALELETSNDWQKSKNIAITGYPPIDQDKGGNGKTNSQDIKQENVKIIHLNGHGNQAITVGPVKYVAEGWSGSAFITPETGKVVGITCTKHTAEKHLNVKIFFNINIPLADKTYITGCDLSSINSLMQRHPLTYTLSDTLFSDTGGKRRFNHILGMLDTIKTNNGEQFTDSVHALYDELPDSYTIRFITGSIISEPNDMASFERMVETAPDSSSYCHAAYGNYLITQNKLKEAVEQFQIVTKHDPDHLFAYHGQLSALVKTDPNAAEDLGQELIHRWPDNAGFHFEYSKALRENNKRKEELPVIQEAVQLCDPNDIPYSYLRYLADSFTANKQYEQAEQTYIKLLEKHECDRCWWAYTLCLLQMGPDKVDHAKNARDKTMTFINDPNEVLEKQNVYEATLEKMLPDPNTPVKLTP